VCDALCADDNSKQKALLDRRVAMLTKRGQRGYAVSGELGGWVGRFDTDADTDVDTDTDPTPIAVPNESAGDTQAKNLFSLFLHHHLRIFAPRNVFAALPKASLR
jgi:hypothetical protein